MMRAMPNTPPNTRIERPGSFTRCYGCGPDNRLGLALSFFRAGDLVEASFQPRPEHGGYGRLLHGGVTAALIDEAFGWALYGLLGKIGMTTDMEVKFSAPLYCDDAIRVRGSIVESSAQAATVRAEVVAAGERVGAVGVGRMRFASLRAIERIGGFKVG